MSRQNEPLPLKKEAGTHFPGEYQMGDVYARSCSIMVVPSIRYNNWKATFLKQDAEGIDVWRQPYTALRAPMLCNLRMDPFERAEHESIGYSQWWVDHMFMFAPAGTYVGQWLQSFREFPPRQKPGSFNLDRVMEAITKGAGDK